MIKPVVSVTTDPQMLQTFIQWGATAHGTSPELVKKEFEKLQSDDKYPSAGLRMPIAQFNALRAAIVIRQALRHEDPHNYLRDALPQDETEALEIARGIQKRIEEEARQRQVLFG